MSCPTPPPFARRLKAIREAKAISQYAVAKTSGIPTSTLSYASSAAAMELKIAAKK